mgnify:CR=1 FL=1
MLKDFLKIFKNDEVSDNVVKQIDQEVIFRKQQIIKKEFQKKLKAEAIFRYYE